MKKRYALLRLHIVSVATLVVAGCVANTNTQAGIRQIIETRGSQHSVWGVTIVLQECVCSRSLNDGDIQIVEEKHGHDITNMMSWSLSEDRRQLRLQFKRGMGDFGTGNSVTVRVKRTAVE